VGRFRIRSRTQVIAFLFCIGFLSVVGLIFARWVSYQKDPAPPLAIQFVGEIRPGLHLNPFGTFLLVNLSDRSISWNRTSVEALNDTNLNFSMMLDSNLPRGTLTPGARTNFPAIVPSARGIPFRVSVAYAFEPNLLDRLRSGLPSSLAVVEHVWPRSDRWRAYTSEWFRATADYTAPGRQARPDWRRSSSD
jgi:hypothetical protein